MKIREKLLAVYDYFLRNRQSGTSTMLKGFAGKVVFPTHELAHGFQNAITLLSLKFDKGKDKTPVVLDNFTVLQLTKEAIVEIDKLEKLLLIKQTAIDEIEKSILKSKKEVINLLGQY